MENQEDFLDEKENYSTNITIKDPLLEPFYVVKDSYCYTLHMKTKTNPKYTVDGTSKDIVKTIGHFTDLASCLKRIAKEKVHFKREYNSVMEYVNEYNRINDEVKTYMKNHINEEY